MTRVCLIGSFYVAGVSATAVVSGDYHTCAIVTGGGVKCWGLNDNGQLGLDNNANVAIPMKLNLSGSLDFEFRNDKRMSATLQSNCTET